jgi:hypothetical protein
LPPKTYSRSAVEGNVSPSGPETGPSLGPEFLCIITKDVCTRVHGVAVSGLNRPYNPNPGIWARPGLVRPVLVGFQASLALLVAKLSGRDAVVSISRYAVYLFWV